MSEFNSFKKSLGWGLACEEEEKIVYKNGFLQFLTAS